MKFRLEKDFLEIFPSARVGVLICRGINNHVEDEEKYLNEYGPYLRESERLGLKHVENPEFIENPTIKKPAKKVCPRRHIFFFMPRNTLFTPVHLSRGINSFIFVHK